MWLGWKRRCRELPTALAEAREALQRTHRSRSKERLDAAVSDLHDVNKAQFKARCADR